MHQYVIPPEGGRDASPGSSLIPPITKRQIGSGLYAASIGIFLLLGYTAAAAATWFVGRHPGWIFPVAGLALSWLGLEISSRTMAWKGSLLGHLVASIGAGLFLGLLFHIEHALWLRTAGLTVFVGTVFLTIIGAFMPGVLRAFGSFVLGLVFAVVVLRFTGPLLQGGIMIPPPGIASTLTAFCVLAFTDRYWTRAFALTPTLDNAADSACAVYMHPLHSLLSLLEAVADRRVSHR